MEFSVSSEPEYNGDFDIKQKKKFLHIFFELKNFK